MDIIPEWVWWVALIWVLLGVFTIVLMLILARNAPIMPSGYDCQYQYEIEYMAEENTVADYPPTEELDKMIKIKDQSEPIGQFLEEMGEKGIRLCDADGDPIPGSIQKILADYFEIDLQKVESERQAVLDYVRSRG